VRTDSLQIADVPPPRAGNIVAPASPVRTNPPALKSIPLSPGSVPAAASSSGLARVDLSARAARIAPTDGLPAATPTDAQPARDGAEQSAAADGPPPAAADRSRSLSLEEQEAVSSPDGRLSAAAASVLAAARDFKISGGTEASGLEVALLRQLDADKKVDHGLRGVIADLQRSGQPVTPEALAQAAGEVLAANGLNVQDVDVEIALARASSPPPKPIDPGLYAQAARAIVADPPNAATRVAILKRAENPPPPPRAPPPEGAIAAYQKHRAVFDRARAEYGVQPQHILGILGVETRWGRVTGDHPLRDTLLALAEQGGGDGQPTRRARQAQRDLAALTRLATQGDLGPLAPKQVRGSWAGAMGVPQFLASSWEAYSRDADGNGRDPFSFPDSVLSVANYLKDHGYNQDVSRAIYGYNHSQAYVNKVLRLSAQVEVGLRGELSGRR